MPAKKRIKLEALEDLPSQPSTAVWDSQVSCADELKGEKDETEDADEFHEEDLPPYHEFHRHRGLQDTAIHLFKRWKGLEWTKWQSDETLLEEFCHRCHRYHPAVEDVKSLWSWSYEERLSNAMPTYRAALKLHVMDDKTFQGSEWRIARKVAMKDAIRAFSQDLEVQEIAKDLPPRQKRIKEANSLRSYEKKEMRAAGIDPKVVQKELMQVVFLHFRKLGGRNAIWDGNA